MNETQLGVIALLKTAITQKAETLPEQFDIERAYPVLRRHGIAAMGYIGALCCGISKEQPAMHKLRMDYYAATLKSEGQLATIRKIANAFDENGIDYMLLKGCNLKLLYPSHELRGMGDADVLIRVEQYPKIRDVLNKLGLAEQEETDHEIIWQSKTLYLELHKKLIPTGNRDYFRYYGNGWKVARRQLGNAYAMSAEDQFIYLFTHFAKHYRDGGIGCRHVTDLWVYLRSNPKLDQTYIRKELETLELLAFYDNMVCLIDAWFQGGSWDERTGFISQVIFASGNWGSARDRALAQGVKASNAAGGSVGRGKFHRFLEMAFPNCQVAGYKYPIVKKCPVLLPAIWVVRAVSTVFTRWNRVEENYRSLSSISAKEIKTHEQSLAYVGLRFEK